MSGIAAYGAFVPAHRVSRALLAGRRAEGGPERSAAWADEDSLTMGVEAARRALAGRPRDAIDLLIFATTTHGFAEKQGGATIAAALGLRPSVRAVDVAHSLRGGVGALRLACEAVDAGAREALVIVADARQGAPGSKLEREGGDAAAAFLIDAKGVVAVLAGAASETQEIVDAWRRPGDRFSHGWEERFTARYGELEPALTAARALVDGQPAPSRWAVGASDARALAAFGARMKLPAGAMAPGLYETIGFAGAAHAALAFVAALDEAGAGERIAVVAHGDGAEALLFETGEGAGQGAVLASVLARRIPVRSLASWRRARALDVGEYAPADDQGISATIHYRERDADLRLQGQRCRCGEPQFPKGRVCIRCGTRDAFAPEDFAERGGRVVTYTLDAFYPAPDPPTAVGIVQAENGPRLYLQIADVRPEEVAIDMPVSFAFRRIHEAGRRPNYFWKAVPAEMAS